MTSNIGGEFIDKMQTIGFASGSDADQYTKTKEKIMDRLKDFFRPEFLNRLDDIIMFDILSPEILKNIVSIQADKLRERLLTKDIKLVISNDALAYLASKDTTLNTAHARFAASYRTRYLLPSRPPSSRSV